MLRSPVVGNLMLHLIELNRTSSHDVYLVETLFGSASVYHPHYLGAPSWLLNINCFKDNQERRIEIVRDRDLSPSFFWYIASIYTRVILSFEIFHQFFFTRHSITRYHRLSACRHYYVNILINLNSLTYYH